MHTWVRAKLNQIVKEELDAGKKIVVCPYGECGMLLDDLLKKAYGRAEDTIILDNGLAKYNPAIRPIAELKEIDTEERTLILTSISARNNEELERQIRELNTGIKIRNLLNPDMRESPEKVSYFQELKKELLCRKVRGKHLIRVGNAMGDGGYIMVDDFDDNMCAYSFGIGNDVSWDMDLAGRGMDVFMYDHTVPWLPQAHPRFHFNRWGVGSGENCFPLRELLRRNHHPDDTRLLLKMDVEGAEWDVLGREGELLNHFSQIALELHDVCRLDYREKILAGLRTLNRTHQAVWIHGNNANRAERAEDILMPNVLEATFVRKDMYLFESGEECVFPLAMDLPNLTGRRDFILGNWGAQRED